MTDRTGQQLGNYRLVRLLGQGGFAEVYLGQHVHVASKQAAIKILHLIDVDARKFQEEAETTEKLVHPHIVRLLDFDSEEDTPFLVLDYAPGGSLRTRHPKGSIVPLITVVGYLKELAPALQYAHDLHILHRDIKPDNVLIGRRGELLLSDFGIAVLTQTGRTSLSSAYGIGGTPYYMAPETYQGRPVKESDQYALAAVVYEWLCGSVPFNEGNFIQLGYQHAYNPVPPLREKVPGIPSAVEDVVLITLAKDPKQRFVSVQDFATALEQAYKEAQFRRKVIIPRTDQSVLPPEIRKPITLPEPLATPFYPELPPPHAARKFSISQWMRQLDHLSSWLIVVLELLLLVRFIFKLVGADPSEVNVFVQFLYKLTGIILLPFSNIVHNPPIHPYQAFELTTLIGMLIFWLLSKALRRFLRVFTDK